MFINITSSAPFGSWSHKDKVNVIFGGRGLRGMVITEHKESFVFPKEPFVLFRDAKNNENFCVPVSSFSLKENKIKCEHEEFLRLVKHVIFLSRVS